MTLLHGPRSGDLVRARRRHHLPAGPAERRRDPDHGLEHGRAAPGRLPVGDRGQGARRDGHARRPALHAHQRDGRRARAAARRHRHRLPRRGHQLHPRERPRVHRVRAPLHQRARDHQGRVPRHRRARRHLLRLGSRRRGLRGRQLGLRGHLGRADRRQAPPDRRRLGRRLPRRARDEARARRAARGGLEPRAPQLRLSDPQAPLRPLHARDGRAGLRRAAREADPGRRDAVPQLRAASARARSATRSAGPSTRTASRTSAPPRSSSCCSATSGAPAAASSRCAATPTSRARPTSRRSTTSCPGYIPMPHPRLGRRSRSSSSS